MVAGPAEKQLPDHGTRKGDRCHILLSGVAGVLLAIQALEDGIDLTDDTRNFVRK